jgi:hypothetical protein
MKPIRIPLSIILVTTGVTVGGMSSAGASNAVIPICTSSQILFTRGPSQPRDIRRPPYILLIFTNSGSTCTISGVPSVQPVYGKSDKFVGPVAQNILWSAHGTSARVILSKGRSASSPWFYNQPKDNYTPSKCAAQQISGALVTLGSIVKQEFIPFNGFVCAKLASTWVQSLIAGQANLNSHQF